MTSLSVAINNSRSAAREATSWHIRRRMVIKLDKCHAAAAADAVAKQHLQQLLTSLWRHHYVRACVRVCASKNNTPSVDVPVSTRSAMVDVCLKRWVIGVNCKYIQDTDWQAKQQTN